jgi:aconitate hydratase 2/2-methylisocitrate dehydratase
MIADPDVNNDDVSKRYTHDTIRSVSYYGGDKKVDLGFVGSCMVHKGRFKNCFPNAQKFGKGSRQG